jgi:hypothetical protein
MTRGLASPIGLPLCRTSTVRAGGQFEALEVPQQVRSDGDDSEWARTIRGTWAWCGQAVCV